MQHLQGYKASRHVRYGRSELAKDLYDHLPTFDRRYMSEDAADSLAAELVAAGYDMRADPNRIVRIANVLQGRDQSDLALV